MMESSETLVYRGHIIQNFATINEILVAINGIRFLSVENHRSYKDIFSEITKIENKIHFSF
jgi:hypothetical protein